MGVRRTVRNEKGTLLILVLLIFVPAFILGVLGLNVAWQNTLAIQSQWLADSLSLSGAQRLNGTRSGWLSVKRAVSIDLEYQRGLGTEFIGAASMQFISGGRSDSMEVDVNFKEIEASFGDYTIVVERGFYSKLPDTGGFEFTSLEGENSDNPLLSSEVVDGQLTTMFAGTPVYMVANAVKVTVSRTPKATILPAIFRRYAVPSLDVPSRTSVSQAHGEHTQCVFPAAIPLCALLPDLSSSDPADLRYQIESLKAQEQCSRELLIREADPLGLSNSASRREGMLRYEAYNRFPRTGGVKNRRGISIGGVWGLPYEGSSPSLAVAEETLISTLESLGGCVPASLGQKFKPIENAVGSGGLYTGAKKARIQMALHSMITSGEHQFLDLYANGMFPSPAFSQDWTESLGVTKPGFPYMSFDLEDRKILFPSQGGMGYVEMAFQTHRFSDQTYNPSGEPFSWVNPMCHHYGIGHPNDPDALTRASSIVANHKSRVKSVIVPVIGPSTPDAYTGSKKYCDFSKTFNFEEQDTTAPIETTTPVILGFVKLKLFDFNIEDFGNLGITGTVNDKIDLGPARFKLDGSIDWNNPVVQAKTKDTLDFTVLNKGWIKCFSTTCTPATAPCSCGSEPLVPLPTFQDVIDVFNYTECWLSDLPSGAASFLEQVAEKLKTMNYPAKVPNPCGLDISCEPFINHGDGVYRRISDGMTDSGYAVNVTDHWWNPGVQFGVNCNTRNQTCFEYHGGVARSWDAVGKIPYADNDPFYAGNLTICREGGLTGAPWLADAAAPTLGPQMQLCQSYFGFTDAEVPVTSGDPTKIDEAIEEASRKVLEDMVSKSGEVELPNRHCLPRPLQQVICTKPECYEPPKPKAAQYGCGGVRGRLDCSMGTAFSPVNSNWWIPSIVE